MGGQPSLQAGKASGDERRLESAETGKESPGPFEEDVAPDEKASEGPSRQASAEQGLGMLVVG